VVVAVGQILILIWVVEVRVDIARQLDWQLQLDHRLQLQSVRAAVMLETGRIVFLAQLHQLVAVLVQQSLAVLVQLEQQAVVAAVVAVESLGLIRLVEPAQRVKATTAAQVLEQQLNPSAAAVVVVVQVPLVVMLQTTQAVVAVLDQTLIQLGPVQHRQV
jgi:hypothetical protein